VPLASLGEVALASAPEFTRYAAGQDCGNCSFYQGKASDEFAPCPMFANKLVASKGWCNAYNKKA